MLNAMGASPVPADGDGVGVDGDGVGVSVDGDGVGVDGDGVGVDGDCVEDDGGGGDGATTVTVAVIGFDGAPTLVTVGAPTAASAVLRVLANVDKAEVFEAMVLMLVAAACWADAVAVATVKLTATPAASAWRRAVVMSVTWVTVTALDATPRLVPMVEAKLRRAVGVNVVDVRPASVMLLATV
jgi:hypothetical protein